MSDPRSPVRRVPAAAPPAAEGAPDDDLLMELARIVADSVPQEAPPATPVRRPPVLIAPRRPVTPNMRPLPSERAAAAARAAAEAANEPAPAAPTEDEAPERGEEDLVETSSVEAETSASAETEDVVEATETVATPAPPRAEPEPEPEPEAEIDEFERALSAELGAAPLRVPAEAPPSAPPPEPRSRVNLTRNEASPRPAEAPASEALPVFVRRQQPEAEATASEPSPRPVTATPLPPRPTVADLAAALSLELDVAPEPAPADADASAPAPADKRDGPRPAVQSATSVWLAELPALELPPQDGEEPAAAASEDAEGDDERARRIAEREQRREQRRAARAQRRGEEEGGESDATPETTTVPAAPVVAAVAGGLGKSRSADTPRAVDLPKTVERPARGESPLGGERAAVTARGPADVPAVETTRPVASPRSVAAPFDFDAFEAEIRSSLDDGPLPEPVRPGSAPGAETSRPDALRAETPAVVAKPAIPKPAGLAPAPVPGRPGEPAAASFAPPLAAPAVDERSAAPRPPKAPVGPDDGYDLDALESEPGHSEDAVLPPHSDAEQRALRSAMRGRRRAPVVAIAAAAAVVLLAGGATAWWLMSSETADGPPPLIQAEGDPVKIDPPVSEARDAGEPGKAFTDRVSEAGDPARQVLDPEGRQTIDLPIAGRQAGDPSLPGVDTDDPLARLAADPNAPVETFAPEPAAELQPKRVRTVVVRPDGTIVPQQDLPTTVTPEPQAPPAAGLTTDPATATADPGGFAPGSQATTAPATAPIPVLEPAAGEDESLAGALGYPMPRRKPLVFDETADLQPRPTSNLPDPLPAAAGTPATPVFGTTQGVATGATGTPSSEPATPLPTASATDAAAAALARGTTTADAAAPATVPTVTAPQPAAPEPVAAAPEPVQPAADDAASADTRAVTTTPIRVATPAARQDPPPAVDTAPAAVEPPLSLPAVTPQPTAPQAAAPAAAAPVAAGRSARLLPPAGAGINPFAPSTEQPTAAAAPPPPAAETAPAPAAAAPAAATTAGGAFAVQLASQKSDAEARAAYASLQRRFPSILGGLSPVIQTADVGTRGTFYRVRLPFGSANEANRLCNDLKAAGGDCFVGRN